MDKFKTESNQEIAHTIFNFLKTNKGQFCAISSAYQNIDTTGPYMDIFLLSQNTLKTSCNLKTLYIATNFHNDELNNNVNLSESHAFTFAGYYVVSEDMFVGLKEPLSNILQYNKTFGKHVEFNKFLTMSQIEEKVLTKIREACFEHGKKTLESKYGFFSNLPDEENMEIAMKLLLEPENCNKYPETSPTFIEKTVEIMTAPVVNNKLIKNEVTFKENITERDFAPYNFIIPSIEQNLMPFAILAYFDNQQLNMLKNQFIAKETADRLWYILIAIFAYKNVKASLLEKNSKNSALYKKIKINTVLFSLENKNYCWITLENQNNETKDFQISIRKLLSASFLETYYFENFEKNSFKEFIGSDRCPLQNIKIIKCGKKHFPV